jgi:hypothetical protein
MPGLSLIPGFCSLVGTRRDLAETPDSGPAQLPRRLWSAVGGSLDLGRRIGLR